MQRNGSPNEHRNVLCSNATRGGEGRAISTDTPARYAFGNTDAEHERLVRQSAVLAPLTERFFQDAGIAPGQRVLEFGSGAGDVAMLAARMVGPSGEVVGIERDARSIELAKKRATRAGLTNVQFLRADVSDLPRGKPFDAAVGRLILQFVPDPAAALRPIRTHVRAGGIVAFQEISWSPFFPLIEHLPLLAATMQLSRETLRRSGANTDMGLDLYHVFRNAGLPTPTMLVEIILDPGAVQWNFDVFKSLLPLIERDGLPLHALGDLDTLAERLHAEAQASDRPIPFQGLVGAWCHI